MTSPLCTQSRQSRQSRQSPPRLLTSPKSCTCHPYPPYIRTHHGIVTVVTAVVPSMSARSYLFSVSRSPALPPLLARSFSGLSLPAHPLGVLLFSWCCYDLPFRDLLILTIEVEWYRHLHPSHYTCGWVGRTGIWTSALGTNGVFILANVGKESSLIDSNPWRHLIEKSISAPHALTHAVSAREYPHYIPLAVPSHSSYHLVTFLPPSQ